MKVKIASEQSVKFNPECLEEGTPVSLQSPGQDFPVLAIIKGYEPNAITLMLNRPKGHGHLRTIEIGEFLADKMELIPLNLKDGVTVITPVTVFHTDGIPVGSIFVDEHGESLFVEEVNQYYIFLRHPSGDTHHLSAEEHFSHPDHSKCEIIVPPAIADQWEKQMEDFKQWNQALEDQVE